MIIFAVSLQIVFEWLFRTLLTMELVFESHGCRFSGIKLLDNNGLEDDSIVRTLWKVLENNITDCPKCCVGKLV